VDGKDGPKSRRAVKGFQKEANGVFGLGLAVDGIMGEKSWIGVLHVLRFLLAQGGVDLAHAWPFVKSGDGIYGCGESFPVKEKGNKNLVSRENRRVEVYFGPAGEITPLDPPPSAKADLTAAECVLFDPEACTVIPFGLKSSVAVRHVDVNGLPIAGAEARLLKSGGEAAAEPKQTNADGFAFWFGLDPGDYEIDFDDAG
jgi:hypothetical protein